MAIYGMCVYVLFRPIYRCPSKHEIILALAPHPSPSPLASAMEFHDTAIRINGAWWHESATAERMEAAEFCPIPGCDQAWMFSSSFHGAQKKLHYRAHIRSHDKGLLPFACAHKGCYKTYNHINSLTTHRKKVHPIPIAE